MPTSIEQDVSLLAVLEKNATAWWEQMLVGFRLERKMALRHAMDLIVKHGDSIAEL